MRSFFFFLFPASQDTFTGSVLNGRGGTVAPAPLQPRAATIESVFLPLQVSIRCNCRPRYASWPTDRDRRGMKPTQDYRLSLVNSPDIESRLSDILVHRQIYRSRYDHSTIFSICWHYTYCWFHLVSQLFFLQKR